MLLLFFFFNDTATTEIYTLSLHDALPISAVLGNPYLKWSECLNYNLGVDATLWNGLLGAEIDVFYKYEFDKRSEEHTSELQSRQYLVCRLLLEKKKNKKHHSIQY